MTRNFWRGLIAGSVLAAVMNMMKKPQRKPGELLGMDRVRRMQPRRAADKMLRGVTRTVDGLIKKR
ncbi:MAG: YtxH domain-containing protein [Desulfotomaculaceae bacterium]